MRTRSSLKEVSEVHKPARVEKQLKSSEKVSYKY